MTIRSAFRTLAVLAFLMLFSTRASAVINGIDANDEFKNRHKGTGLLLSGRGDRGLPIAWGTAFLVGCRQVILTVGHNIRQSGTPANTTFVPADAPGVHHAAQVIRFAPDYASETNADLALIKLAQPMAERYGTAAYVLQRPPGRIDSALIMGYGYDDFPQDLGTCGILRMGWIFNRNKTHGETAMGRNAAAAVRPMLHHDLSINNQRRERRRNRLFKLWQMDSGGPVVDCGREDTALNCNRVYGVYSAGTYTRETRFNENGSERLDHYGVFASIWDNRDWLRQNINDLCGQNVIPPPDDWPAPVAPADSRSLSGKSLSFLVEGFGGVPDDNYLVPGDEDIEFSDDEKNDLQPIHDDGAVCSTCSCEPIDVPSTTFAGTGQIERSFRREP